MSRFRLGLLIALTVLAIPHASSQGATMTPSQPTAAEVEKILAMPHDLSERRSEISAAVVRALGIVQDFAAAHGWSDKSTAPFFHRVEIFAHQDALWARILGLHGLKDVPMPTDGLTAALEMDILLAVVPEEARRVRPEYFHTKEDWTRALAHEIVHRLHVRLLDGNEERMGEPWFFEGFAILGSGQMLGAEHEPRTLEEAFALTRLEGRGCYAGFAAAMRFFSQRVDVAELVTHAGDEGFEAWLRKAAAPRPPP